MKRSYGRAFYGSGIDAGSAVAAQAGLGGSSGVVKQDDLIYVNLTCINSGLNTSGQTLGPPVIFQESRAVNLLDNSSDYMLTIIRWTSTGLQLPLFIPTIDNQPGNDPNKTTYQVGMTVYTPPGTAYIGTAGGALNYSSPAAPGLNQTLVISGNTLRIGYNSLGVASPVTPAVGDSIWIAGVPDRWTTTGLNTNKAVDGFGAEDDGGDAVGVGDRFLSVTAVDTTNQIITCTTGDGPPFSPALQNSEYDETTVVHIATAQNAPNVAASTTGGGSVSLSNEVYISVLSIPNNHFTRIGSAVVSCSEGIGGWGDKTTWASDLTTALNACLNSQPPSGSTSWGGRILPTSGATVTADGGVLSKTTSPGLTLTIPSLVTRTGGTMGLQAPLPNWNGTAWDVSLGTSLPGCNGYNCLISGGSIANGNAGVNGLWNINQIYLNGTNVRGYLQTIPVANGGTGPIAPAFLQTIAGSTFSATYTTTTATLTKVSGNWSDIFPTAASGNAQVYFVGMSGTGGAVLNGSQWGRTLSGNVMTITGTFPAGAPASTNGTIYVGWYNTFYNPGAGGTDGNPFLNCTLTTWPSNPEDPNYNVIRNFDQYPVQNWPYTLYLNFNPGAGAQAGGGPSGKYLWNMGGVSAPGEFQAQQLLSFTAGDVVPLIGGPDALGQQTAITTAAPPTGSCSITVSQANSPSGGLPYLLYPHPALNWAPNLKARVATCSATAITVGGLLVTYTGLTGGAGYAVGDVVTVSGAVVTAWPKLANGTIYAVTANTSMIVSYPLGLGGATPGSYAATIQGYAPMTIRGGSKAYTPWVFTRTLEWVPQYPGDPVPFPPASNGGNQDIRQGSRYYWATDPQHVLNMVNNGLGSIWDSVWNNTAAVGTNFPGFGTLLNPAPPRFEWNAGAIQLLLPAADYTFSNWSDAETPDTPGWSEPRYYIQMNPALYALFRGFAAVFVPSPLASYSTDLTTTGWPTSDWGPTDNEASTVTQGVYQLLGPSMTSIQQQFSTFAGNGSGGAAFTVNPYQTLVMNQQSACTDNWAAVSALSFHTSLPIVPEDESAPAQSGTEFQPSTSQDVVTSMTDIQLDLAGGVTDWLGKINYAPAAQYRWTLMRGGPVQNVPFTVYWKHRGSGKRYLVTMAPNASVEVKMLLQRRKH